MDLFDKVIIKRFKDEFLELKVPWFQQNGVFIVFLPPLMVWSFGQNIGFNICFPWFVFEFELIFSKFSDPPGLLTNEFWGFSEILKVLMICPSIGTILLMQALLGAAPCHRFHNFILFHLRLWTCMPLGATSCQFSVIEFPQLYNWKHLL